MGQAHVSFGWKEGQYLDVGCRYYLKLVTSTGKHFSFKTQNFGVILLDFDEECVSIEKMHQL